MCACNCQNIIRDQTTENLYVCTHTCDVIVHIHVMLLYTYMWCYSVVSHQCTDSHTWFSAHESVNLYIVLNANMYIVLWLWLSCTSYYVSICNNDVTMELAACYITGATRVNPIWFISLQSCGICIMCNYYKELYSNGIISLHWSWDNQATIS